MWLSEHDWLPKRVLVERKEEKEWVMGEEGRADWSDSIPGRVELWTMKGYSEFLTKIRKGGKTGLTEYHISGWRH